MSVRLLFPTFMFEYNIVEEGLVSEEYLMSLKNDMDAMRKKDPVGRRVSNQYTDGNLMMGLRVISSETKSGN